MGSHTTPRPYRKRSSPRPNESSDDEAKTVKRHRGHSTKRHQDGMGAKGPFSPEGIPSTPLAQRAVNVAGKPPEAGIIQQIYVENFMCHRKLTVDLCRNVNFIYGQNGSGKSAILAAIQICLGAGARRTHRARNIKELVRKDAACASAKIRVTLLNRGADGFQPDVYGDSITVERTIALRGGFNGYKLYDCDMKEQSRSKKDLDDMLDKLNIQVENPVAILDQEEAKKFLTGKAEDKYDFFMKATELERIDRTYGSTLDKVGDLDSQSYRMNQGLEKDVQLVEETKKRWEQHQEIDKLERKKKAYEEGYAWAVYAETVTTRDTEIEHVKQFREKAEKRRKELSQAEEASQGTDDEETAKRNKLEELSREAQEQSQLKQNLQADAKRATEPQKALERELKMVRKQASTAQENVRRAKAKLQEKRDEIRIRAGSAESEASQRTKRLEEAENNLAAARTKHDELQQAVSDALRAYEELEPHVGQARQNCTAARSRLDHMEQKISSMERGSGNNLAVFGQRCPAVSRLVEQFTSQGKFKGPVLGPIGKYLKIAEGKEQYASIAELALGGGGTMDRFFVTNDHDRKVLQTIRKKAGCHQDCGIFQGPLHARYNIPPPPADGIETVASVLNISNDLVFNCLVDNCKIDSRALASSKEEGERLLLVTGQNGRHSIRGKIKNVFCLPQGDNWSVTKSGAIVMVANEKKLRRTIGVDRTAALDEAKREADAAREEVAQLANEESRIMHQHHENQKLWNVKKREHQTNRKAIDKFKAAIDKIREEQDTAANFDTDTSEYEQDVAEAQEGLEKLKEKDRAVRADIEAKQPAIDELRAKLEEVKVRNEKVLREISAAEDDLARYMQSLSQRQEKLVKKRDKLKHCETIIRDQEEKIKEIDADVARYLHKARQLTFDRKMREQRDEQRADENGNVDYSQFTQEPTEEDLEKVEIVHMEKPPTYYETRLKRAKAKIHEEKQRRNAARDDPAAAYEKYHRAKQQLENKLEKIKQIDDTSNKLKADMHQRKRRWRQFREHIAKTTDQRFDEILNLKGSSGEIDFCHGDKQLNLIVQKDSQDANSQQKDVKALSGGERSYTTIALLLALGESLETPFRVLDEFDVFLDPVTRNLTIEALIKMAKGMQHRQFIFITPQDVSNVETDPMLKVLKMTPPARNDVARATSQAYS